MKPSKGIPGIGGVGLGGLIPENAIREVEKVLQVGARKHGEWDWLEYPRPYSHHADHLLAHMEAWLKGEDKEEESGYSHLSHVVCRALFLIALQNIGYVAGDDRATLYRKRGKNDE